LLSRRFGQARKICLQRVKQTAQNLHRKIRYAGNAVRSAKVCSREAALQHLEGQPKSTNGILPSHLSDRPKENFLAINGAAPRMTAMRAATAAYPTTGERSDWAVRVGVAALLMQPF